MNLKYKYYNKGKSKQRLQSVNIMTLPQIRSGVLKKNDLNINEVNMLKEIMSQ
jgi:hypothetical protein